MRQTQDKVSRLLQRPTWAILRCCCVHECIIADRPQSWCRHAFCHKFELQLVVVRFWKLWSQKFFQRKNFVLWRSRTFVRNTFPYSEGAFTSKCTCVHRFHMLLKFVLSAKSAKKRKLICVQKFLRLQNAKGRYKEIQIRVRAGARGNPPLKSTLKPPKKEIEYIKIGCRSMRGRRTSSLKRQEQSSPDLRTSVFYEFRAH